ncbi:cytochrome P450 4C1-like [Aethina tumida]|uniref:cytochrome P450 4C1-like n=1 Tax=Aethina tumida TaxID=116153 RepID=UPI000E33F416|nr:cytochrome P450 4C1-like [Aethina tumida]
MFIELVLVTAIISVIVYRFLSKTTNKAYDTFYNTPSPIRFPVLGSSYLLFGRNILLALTYNIEKYGQSFLAYIPHRTYVTAIPEEVKIILNHPNALNKSKEYNHLRWIFAKSLLLTHADPWRVNRKLISRSFKQGILDSFVTTFYKKSCLLNDILRRDAYKNIYYLLEEFTLDVFSEATLGIESSILKDEKEHRFVVGVTTIQTLLMSRIGNIIKMNDFIFSFLPDGIRAKKCRTDMNNYIQDIIEKKRSIGIKQDIYSPSARLPVLDLLLEIAEKENLTDNYISEEMFLFAGAATDTTAYTIAYACCLLGMHPEIQEKIYKEIIETIGKEEEILYSDLSKLKYTEMALNETQRILPSIPIIGRHTTADISLGDKVIPKNTGIIISIFNIHRNPEYYPDPLVFNPDRFLPEEVAKRPQNTFLPFSQGPRNCIGMKYASMLMKTAIVNIVRNFKISSKYKSVSELKLVSNVVMSTTHPLDLTFTPRS